MKNDLKPEPDYGATTVWSNDFPKGVKMLLEEHGGDIDAALSALFRTGGTTYEKARGISGIFAPLFGLSEAEFMKKHKNWKLARPMTPK
jgi:hypothetical protein